MKTGNHTINRQWIYVLVNIPFVWVCKIGIGGNLPKRVLQVDKSAPGKDLLIMAAKLPFAYQIEQFLHGLFSFFRVKFYGSGKTERFLVVVAPFAIAIIFLLLILEWAFYVAMVVGFYLFLGLL